MFQTTTHKTIDSQTQTPKPNQSHDASSSAHAGGAPPAESPQNKGNNTDTTGAQELFFQRHTSTRVRYGSRPHPPT